jgi:hypothetical protein
MVKPGEIYRNHVLSTAMIPVAVTMLITPDQFAPIGVMAAPGFNRNTGNPDIHLGSRG